MRFAVLLMAVCLCGPGYARAHHNASSSKASSARSSRGHHTSTHGRSSRSRYQATPSPGRYKDIQQVLADKGYYKGPVNGVWGSDSVAALKRFQSDQKLQPDGHITALSLNAMGLGAKRAPVAKATPPESEPSQTTPAGSTPNDHRSPEGSQRP